MSSAWRQYSPNDDNGDNNGTVARLNRSIESTRVAVAHVLQSSGKAIVYRAPWRPEEYFDLDTSLAQFRHKVMPFAHRDSPHVLDNHLDWAARREGLITCHPVMDDPIKSQAK